MPRHPKETKELLDAMERFINAHRELMSEQEFKVFNSALNGFRTMADLATSGEQMPSDEDWEVLMDFVSCVAVSMPAGAMAVETMIYTLISAYMLGARQERMRHIWDEVNSISARFAEDSET